MKVKKTEGHSWDRIPPKLPPEKQTKLTFFALGAMLPQKESKATVGNNEYGMLPKKLASKAEKTTELAWEYFPHLEPKFRK